MSAAPRSAGGTVRTVLALCRAKRDAQAEKHAAELARVRSARDGFRAERDRLRAHFETLNETGAHGRYCGCYVLMKRGRAVYVGQSVNVFGRIASHRGSSSPTRGDFDEVRVIWCAAGDLDATERALIEELQPALNSEGVSRPYIARNRANRMPATFFGPVFVDAEATA